MNIKLISDTLQEIEEYSSETLQISSFYRKPKAKEGEETFDNQYLIRKKVLRIDIDILSKVLELIPNESAVDCVCYLIRKVSLRCSFTFC